MSLKKGLGKSLVFAVLLAGAMLGSPLSPRQIEELIRVTNKTHHEQVLRSEDDDGLDQEPCTTVDEN